MWINDKSTLYTEHLRNKFRIFLERVIKKYLAWKFDVKVFGKPRRGSILISNHPSLLDGVILVDQFPDKLVMFVNEWQPRRFIFGCLFDDPIFIEVPNSSHTIYNMEEQVRQVKSATDIAVTAIYLGLSVLIFDGCHLIGDPNSHPPGMLNRIRRYIPDIKQSYITILGLKNSEFSWRNGRRPCLWVGIIKSFFKRKRPISIICTEQPFGSIKEK